MYLLDSLFVNKFYKGNLKESNQCQYLPFYDYICELELVCFSPFLNFTMHLTSLDPQGWVWCIPHRLRGTESGAPRCHHHAQDWAVSATVPDPSWEVREDAKWCLHQAEVPGREQGLLKASSALHVRLTFKRAHHVFLLFLLPNRWRYCITSSSCSTMP